MKSPILLSIGLLVAGCLSIAPVYATDIEQLDGLEQTELPVLESNTAWDEPTLRLDPANIPKRSGRGASAGVTDIVLPPLSASELQQWQQPDSTPQQREFRIGMSCSVSQPLPPADQWQWLAVAGGQVAHLGWQSPQAERIRGQLQLGKLPAGVELRFYTPQNPAQVYAYTRDTLYAQAFQENGDTVFWSPSLAGDTLKLEVFLPTGVDPTELELTVRKVSHTVLNPLTGKVQSGTLENNSVSCFLDMACATPEWQQRGRSTALYLFIKDGKETLCTGELLNNTKRDGTPYFLTANHCVSTPEVAATLNSFWFYENSTCGGDDARDRILVADGGATLLATDSTVDTTLLRLNKIPREGLLFAGWSNAPLVPNSSIVGIHHALLQPKKFSQGEFLDYASFSSDGSRLIRNSAGEWAVVQWRNSVTGPGASGSALWFENQGNYYVQGVLYGGTSSCERPDGIDWYGRFDQAYPLLKQWLNP